MKRHENTLPISEVRHDQRAVGALKKFLLLSLNWRLRKRAVEKARKNHEFEPTWETTQTKKTHEQLQGWKSSNCEFGSISSWESDSSRSNSCCQPKQSGDIRFQSISCVSSNTWPISFWTHELSQTSTLEHSNHKHPTNISTETTPNKHLNYLGSSFWKKKQTLTSRCWKNREIEVQQKTTDFRHRGRSNGRRLRRLGASAPEPSRVPTSFTNKPIWEQFQKKKRGPHFSQTSSKVPTILNGPPNSRRNGTESCGPAASSAWPGPRDPPSAGTRSQHLAAPRPGQANKNA